MINLDLTAPHFPIKISKSEPIYHFSLILIEPDFNLASFLTFLLRVKNRHKVHAAIYYAVSHFSL